LATKIFSILILHETINEQRNSDIAYIHSWYKHACILQ